jgi:hypothetical protein
VNNGKFQSEIFKGCSIAGCGGEGTNESITTGEGGNTSTNWLDAVRKMAEWYQNNVHTYQTGTNGKAHNKRGWYFCPYVKQKVGDDCSGFVTACLWLHGVPLNFAPSSAGYISPDNDTLKKLTTAGFKKIPYNAQAERVGDINCKKGHIEIVAPNGKAYSWGNIHDGRNGRPGMPCPAAFRGRYTYVWRKIG